MLLKIGDPLVGRLLAYDSLEESFRTFKVRRDPECPACGENAAPIRHRRVRRPLHAPRRRSGRRLTLDGLTATVILCIRPWPEPEFSRES